MRGICTIVSSQKRRRARAYFFPVVIAFCIAIAGLSAGCGFHRLWSFSQQLDEWDHRIPGWRVKVDIVHFCSEGSEPPINFIFEIEVEPSSKHPQTMIGLDSIEVMKYFDVDESPLESKTYSFSTFVSQPHKRVRTHTVLEYFNQIPDSMHCLAYYTLLQKSDSTISRLNIEYPLYFKKKKRFWLGT